MLCDVGLNRRHHLLGLWVLTYLLHQCRVLHHGSVHSDVSVVVLVDERLGRLAVEERHVLGHGVAGLHVVIDRHQLVSVLDAKHLNHLAVQLGQVINLRRALGQLDHSLVLHDPLGHGRAVGVGHGDHGHQIVVAALGFTVTGRRVERVLLWGVVADDVAQQLELLLHGEVHPGLHRAHGLELALEQREGGTHRSIRTHVTHVHVGDRAQTTAFVGDLVQQG